ncbi:MAG TPA: thiol-disulfide oxidoreductase DCC family protein [Chryseolinea sp.]|nr:thiol-disulfide oxidoreductase DCC family protein [Chryseolinea sp.]HPM30186.1 thiol-disulfide oxidoreductase DCC family protein [Chryseolinea sp.]
MDTPASIEVNQKIIILFDGVCNLCNGAVQFIINRDPEEKFIFASLQSTFGKAQLIKAGLDPQSLQSIVVIDHCIALQRSDAALKIASHLNGIWSYLTVFKVVPRFIRDGIYNLIARYRYTFFGKQDRCMIPTPQLRARFADF